jgi:hypothetical protein
MMYSRALKPLVKSPERARRARWSRAYLDPTTRVEPHGGDDGGMEVLVGCLCPAVSETSLGGWTPIRALRMTTRAVPSPRSQHNVQRKGETEAGFETIDSIPHYHGVDCTITHLSQADGRLAQRAAEFSDARTHRGSTRHLQGGWWGSSLTIPSVRDEKTLVFACCIRDCHPITIGNGKSAASIGLFSRV